jgi:hypothetical protein
VNQPSNPFPEINPRRTAFLVQMDRELPIIAMDVHQFNYLLDNCLFQKAFMVELPEVD